MSGSMSGSRKSTGGNDQVLQSGGSSGVRASESRLRGFHCRVLTGMREWEGEWNFLPRISGNYRGYSMD